ncbi:hypothetical protein D3C81_1877240 [compost metagenome]
MQAVAQVAGVDVERQAPAVDVDLYVTGLAGVVDSLEGANALGGIAQLLVNLAGGEGGHGCLRGEIGEAQDNSSACKKARLVWPGFTPGATGRPATKRKPGVSA